MLLSFEGDDTAPYLSVARAVGILMDSDMIQHHAARYADGKGSDHIDHPLRVLFLGGCHLNGFGVVQGPGMVDTAVAVSGRTVQVTKLTHMRMRHVAKVQARLGSAPVDAVVLQIGHYESTTPFGHADHPRRAAKGMDAPSGEPPGDTPPDGHLFPTARRRLLFRLRQLVKVAWFLAHGRDKLDLAARMQELRTMVQAIQAAEVGHVLLLAPFACADWVVAWRRRRMSRLFRALAAETGCDFLEVDLPADEPLTHFFDAIHLARPGHDRVGEAVGRWLAALPARGPAPVSRG